MGRAGPRRPGKPGRAGPVPRRRQRRHPQGYPYKAPTQDPTEPQKPPRTAFLRRLTAQGFRGIGPRATLDVTPGPGLTLVVGRNGSGKSSFAEGLELLLTGDTYRWSQRSKVWRDGPIFDEGPSKLYDALSKVLGLDALVDAQTALQQARSARDKAPTLDGESDERAARAKEALGKKDWGLKEVEALLAGEATSREGDSAIEHLRRLAVIQAPDPQKVSEAVLALRHADQGQKAAAQTVAGKSEQLASLLDHALRFYEARGDGDCPVCGRPNALDKEWHQAKAQEAEELRKAAREATLALLTLSPSPSGWPRRR